MNSELPTMKTWSLVMIASNLGTLGLSYASKLPPAAMAGPAINLLGLGMSGVLAYAGEPKDAARCGLITSAISLMPTVVSWRSARHPVLLNAMALTGVSAAFYASKFGTDAKE
jgi:hypothetical protein